MIERGTKDTTFTVQRTWDRNLHIILKHFTTLPIPECKLSTIATCEHNAIGAVAHGIHYQIPFLYNIVIVPKLEVLLILALG